MTGRKLILASGSPRRRGLLAELVHEFEVIVPGIAEDEEGPIDGLARRLAVLKARAVADDHPGSVALGADTVVVLDGRSFGKPADAAAATEMLRELRGRTHEVHTAIAVAFGPRCWSDTSTSMVTMAAMSKSAIQSYVDSGRPLDKAGAYAIQDDDVPTVEHLDGCYCGVMGLPLWLAWRLLGAAGIEARAPGMVRCQACPERYLSGIRRNQGVVAEATSEYAE